MRMNQCGPVPQPEDVLPQPPICIRVDPWTQDEHLADGFAEARKTEVDSVRKRLVALQEAFDLPGTSALSAAADVPASIMAEILETDQIDDRTAAIVARRFGVEYDWLRHGIGPMQRPGAEAEGHRGFDSDQAAEKLPRGRTRTQGTSSKSGAAMAMVSKASAKLSAGGGLIPEEGTTGEEYAFRMDYLRAVATSPKNVILIDVKGDSMLPILEDGDTILIDRGRTELIGDGIYAIAVGDVLQCKQLQQLTVDRILVKSVNPLYHSYEVRPDEIRIIGEAIWFGRTLIRRRIKK
jgi:phage repressor protein C with HTH and peptisase S24 domain